MIGVVELSTKLKMSRGLCLRFVVEAYSVCSYSSGSPAMISGAAWGVPEITPRQGLQYNSRRLYLGPRRYRISDSYMSGRWGSLGGVEYLVAGQVD